MTSIDLLSKIEKLLSEWWIISHQHECHLAELDEFKAATENSEVKNRAWARTTALQAHLLYLEIFSHLKAEDFYRAWCQLERLEILLSELRNNQEHISGDCGQSYLLNAVDTWQTLYPYKLFTSSCQIIKKMSCSICKTPRSVLKGCRHRKGKLYTGEICYDEINDFDLIAFDIVSNPVIKTAVLRRPEADYYDYSLLKAALRIATTPRDCFTAWKIDIPLAKHTGVYSPTSTCPCMRSIRNYEDCCMSRPTVETNHIIFDVFSPRRVALRVLDDKQI